MATNDMGNPGIIAQDQGHRFEESSPAVRSMEDEARPAHYLERLLVRSTGRVVFVRANEIEWCQACENYIQLHSGQQCHLLRGTMTQLETQLDPNRFVRISRSAIINLDFVKEIRSVPAKGRVVRLLGGTQINVGREYRSNLKKALASETL